MFGKAPTATSASAREDGSTDGASTKTRPSAARATTKETEERTAEEPVWVWKPEAAEAGYPHSRGLIKIKHDFSSYSRASCQRRLDELEAVAQQEQ